MTSKAKFFPDPDSFFSAIGIDPVGLKSNQKIQVDGSVLALLLTLALKNFGMDEDAYLEMNRDLSSAWDAGEVTDLSLHYATTGFFEGRLAPPKCFDPDWYVQRYVDVAAAIASGDVKDATDHYANIGIREWRLPCAEAENDLIYWRNTLFR